MAENRWPTQADLRDQEWAREKLALQEKIKDLELRIKSELDVIKTLKDHVDELRHEKQMLRVSRNAWRKVARRLFTLIGEKDV